jgi:hypothetical protein
MRWALTAQSPIHYRNPKQNAQEGSKNFLGNGVKEINEE